MPFSIRVDEQKHEEDLVHIGSPSAAVRFELRSSLVDEEDEDLKDLSPVTGNRRLPGSDLLGSEKRCKLVLADGTEMEGVSFGAEIPSSGEVVFNTGMVGYPESLTDPSYSGQILVITYPLVGNYGVPDMSVLDNLGLPKFFESDKVQISGLVVSSYTHAYSHWAAKESLSDWLKRYKVPAIYGIDTRALTKKLRNHGSILGKIMFPGKNTDFMDPNKTNLVAAVSRKKPQVFGDGKIKIIAVDCGMKNNIIRYPIPNSLIKSR